MSFTQKNIELLSPAKNLECGIAAIDSGADAVYIGASAFGARVAAGNPLNDIEQLIRYAHRFRAKVMVTLNTILSDNELKEAEQLANQLYELGTDALIIQDMGLLQLDLPPIALHASTQTDNRTVEKVSFLEKVGFQRVVLARELSLAQISEIRKATSVELEAFVHGSLCVSYSGQCYMSQAVSGRSANRGCCAQLCRLPYSLVDGSGRVLADRKHLLSLKDMDRSDYLYDMMNAGVSSFKIEGRLKDVDYVKNITAYYRKRIDDILEKDGCEYSRASFGKSVFYFEPDTEKTFHRGKTDYFLNGERLPMSQPATPKSVGKYIGDVVRISDGKIIVKNCDTINNGDGLCFFTDKGEFSGFRVNRTDGGVLFPAEMPRGLRVGMKLFRNFDSAFQKILKQKCVERRLWLDVEIGEAAGGFEICLHDEAGDGAKLTVTAEKVPAQKKGLLADSLKTQFSKLGNTIFKLRNFTVNCGDWFIPASVATEWRRQSVELLLNAKDNWRPSQVRRTDTLPEFYKKNLDYRANIMNSEAEQFYKNHGCATIEKAFEIAGGSGVEVMRCKFCLRHEMGICHKQPQKQDKNIKEPLYLVHESQRFRLQFDCARCEMAILSDII
ncbi:MAG: U32 family peptidase [Bacteroidales bacterium]|nr:U32 family peptidase [Bacteroidales bacterium]